MVFNNTAAQSASALSVPGGGSSALLPENFNNIVDANFTIASLTYTNLCATYHNTAIASGKALNLTNPLTVGASAINNAVNRPSGILYLAKTNVLIPGFQTTTSEAGTTTGNSGIVVGDCNQNNGSPSYIYLRHANTIAADTISIGRQKANGNLLFNPIYANTAP